MAENSAPRLDDDALDPHLPEHIRGEKRLGIQRSDWMSGWFVPWSPRNDNQNAEGPWSHWVQLAHAIITADGKAHADARCVPVPDQRVPLAECPPGLFWYGDTLAMKTEYTTTLENPRRYQCDAYIVASGEYFAGGVGGDVAKRAALMVLPIEEPESLLRIPR